MVLLVETVENGLEKFSADTNTRVRSTGRGFRPSTFEGRRQAGGGALFLVLVLAAIAALRRDAGGLSDLDEGIVNGVVVFGTPRY